MNDNDLMDIRSLVSTGGLLSEVYSISESEFRKNDIKRRRTSVQSDDYVVSSQSSESSEFDSDYEVSKKKGKKKSVKKLYHCHICNYSSVLKHFVDKHVKSHTNGRSFTCTTCGMKYTDKLQLVTHQRMHHIKIGKYEVDESCVIVNVDKINDQTPKKYKCNQCEFTSFNITSLKIHKRSHIKDRPYRCPKCPYATCDSLILTKHAKSHNSEPKPFKCDICFKFFAEVYELTKHKVEHFTGQHYFKCGICPYKCVALV